MLASSEVNPGHAPQVLMVVIGSLTLTVLSGGVLPGPAMSAEQGAGAAGHGPQLLIAAGQRHNIGEGA